MAPGEVERRTWLVIWFESVPLLPFTLLHSLPVSWLLHFAQRPWAEEGMLCKMITLPCQLAQRSHTVHVYLCPCHLTTERFRIWLAFIKNWERRFSSVGCSPIAVKTWVFNPSYNFLHIRITIFDFSVQNKYLGRRHLSTTLWPQREFVSIVPLLSVEYNAKHLAILSRFFEVSFGFHVYDS